jgi:rhodanese-related sulfurtransferase
MPSPTVCQLSRRIGLPQALAIVDVRSDEDYRADPRFLPGSLRRDDRAISHWAAEYHDEPVVAVCQKGRKLSEGAAAWLRHDCVAAEVLEGGLEGRKKAGELLVRTDRILPRDKDRMLWVTRSRAQDRLRCLSLADPPLPGPERCLPLCHRLRGDRRRGTLQRQRQSVRSRALAEAGSGCASGGEIMSKYPCFVNN